MAHAWERITRTGSPQREDEGEDREREPFVKEFNNGLPEVAAFRARPEAVQRAALTFALNDAGVFDEEVIDHVCTEVAGTSGAPLDPLLLTRENNEHVRDLAMQHRNAIREKEENGRPLDTVDRRLARMHPYNRLMLVGLRSLRTAENNVAEAFLDEVADRFDAEMEQAGIAERNRRHVLTRVRSLCTLYSFDKHKNKDTHLATDPAQIVSAIQRSLSGTTANELGAHIPATIPDPAGGGGAVPNPLVDSLLNLARESFEIVPAGGTLTQAQSEAESILMDAADDVYRAHVRSRRRAAVPATDTDARVTEPHIVTASDVSGGTSEPSAYTSAPAEATILSRPERLVGRLLSGRSREVRTSVEGLLQEFQNHIRPRAVQEALFRGFEVDAKNDARDAASMADYVLREGRLHGMRGATITSLEQARVAFGEQINLIRASLSEKIREADTAFVRSLDVTPREEAALRGYFDLRYNPHLHGVGDYVRSWWNHRDPRAPGSYVHPNPSHAQLDISAFTDTPATAPSMLARVHSRLDRGRPRQDSRAFELASRLDNYLKNERSDRVFALIRRENGLDMVGSTPNESTPQSTQDLFDRLTQPPSASVFASF